MVRHLKCEAAKIILLVFILLGVSSCSKEKEVIGITPGDLIKKVTDVYVSMNTFKAEGTIITSSKIEGEDIKIEQPFKILIQKPDHYLIVNGIFDNKHDIIDSGAVWNDGSGVSGYQGYNNTYKKLKNQNRSVGCINMALIPVPCLMIDGFFHTKPFSMLKTSEITGIETINSQKCYVLAGASVIWKKETFWISTKDYTILQYYHSLENNLPEEMNYLKNSKNETLSGFDLQNLKGGVTVLYKTISSPELTKDDFRFDLPEGAVLEDSEAVDSDKQTELSEKLDITEPVGDITPDSDIAADQLIEKVRYAYETIQTYKSEGEIVRKSLSDGKIAEFKTKFTMKLKKPNSYLISWEMDMGFMPGFTQTGAVWNNDFQSYLFMGIAGQNKYYKMKSDEMALASATGVSSGVAFNVPMRFLQVENDSRPLFSQLTDPVVLGTQVLNGQDCYVLSGASNVSVDNKFWISKDNFLIVKFYDSHQKPDGYYDEKPEEITDEQIEDILKQLGLEVTESNIAKIRKNRERPLSLDNDTKEIGYSCETHNNVSISELNDSDFKFNLPEDAVLKDSLFDGF